MLTAGFIVVLKQAACSVLTKKAADRHSWLRHFLQYCVSLLSLYTILQRIVRVACWWSVLRALAAQAGVLDLIPNDFRLLLSPTLPHTTGYIPSIVVTVQTLPNCVNTCCRVYRRCVGGSHSTTAADKLTRWGIHYQAMTRRMIHILWLGVYGGGKWATVSQRNVSTAHAKKTKLMSIPPLVVVLLECRTPNGSTRVKLLMRLLHFSHRNAYPCSV